MLIGVVVGATLLLSCLAQDQKPVYKFGINFFAADTGYFEVEGHDGVLPELEMEVGKTYVFDQTNDTNWMHPLGFAYYPDGAHDNKDEVETDSLVYLIDGVQPAENLDGYEPEFYYPKEAWLKKTYTVELTITPEILALAKGGVIFYFCHIHTGMSGRIKLVDADGNPVTPNGSPPELYAPHQPSDFDAMCGTYEAQRFAAGASPDVCPGQTFLCDDESSEFLQCMHAIDCKMNYEMRVENTVEDPVATFMHQMIPHHDNAVNMAKILLKHGGASLEDEEVTSMLYEIINTQNAQITFMSGWLRDHGFDTEGTECEASSPPPTDVRPPPAQAAGSSGSSLSQSTPAGALLTVLLLVFAAFW